MRLRLLVVVALLTGACSPDASNSAQRSVDDSAQQREPAGTAGQNAASGAARRQDAAGQASQSGEPHASSPREADSAEPAAAGRNPQAGSPRVNPNAATLKDFNDRIEAYMDVRGDAKGEAPSLKETSDPAKIKAAQEGLAVAIRQARATAKPGDIFTPVIRTMFRQVMYPELTGEDGRDARAVIKDDAPKAVALKVNADYVSDMKPTVPSNVLASLPMLPKELEYRIVNKDLILIDADANLIIDFIPNAIQ